jgi:hypothetical protein
MALVRRVPTTEQKPHGLEDSLTLHDADGERLVGFDNSHPIRQGSSLDEDAASAGRIDARLVVTPGQRQNAEAGAKALLGMRPCSDDGLEKCRGRGADLLAGRDRSSGRPLAIAAMGARHVIGNRGVWPRRLGARAWLAILWPLWKISTVLSAMRTSTSSRIRR